MTILSLSLLTSGCASMINGQQQTIHVKSHEDATIYIDGRFAGQGMAQRKVSRDESHQIIVELNDCQIQYDTESRFNKTSLLGLLLDLGLISIPTDFLTGAAWQVHPNKIQLIPECN
ncbi:hypothetical protein HF888_05155 [Bermanella marisrubri]|nr:hypothetical protein [Bermanella marisrubri]QIZ83646.1 hypothetical protein HF888_05155 [Bermanella marisrubri]